MDTTDPDFETPVLLVAMPQILDPFFHRSVVLLLHHSDEGSFGLVVNRTTGIKVSEILDGMEIDWTGHAEDRAYFGGPVQPQLGTVLFEPTPDSKALDEGTAIEVLPGLQMTQHVGELTSLAQQPPGFFRLLLGYAGWGQGQLMEEVARHDWLTVPLDDRILFSTTADDLWTTALAKMGIDPAHLPSWSPSSDDEAN